jgi:hypothetical protein
MTKLILVGLGSIIAIALFFFSVLYIATVVSRSHSRKRMSSIYNASPYRQEENKKKKHNNKPDEYKERNEEKEKAIFNKQQNYYKKFSEEEIDEEDIELEEGEVSVYNEKKQQIGGKDDTTIVGIAEPTGFWSKFVMSQKMGFLMQFQQQMNKGRSGFWVNLINAQARSQSKEKGRGL